MKLILWGAENATTGNGINVNIENYDVLKTGTMAFDIVLAPNEEP